MTSAGRRAWSRFVRVSKPYFTSDQRGKALGLAAVLVALLLALTGLNVVNSYVNRDFMTAVEERQPQRVYWLALAYLAVFAASTAAGGFQQFTEQLLGLRWREWLTRNVVGRYLSGDAYYRINQRDEVDNPDQRIAEDVKTFTATTLSFFIMVFNSVITVIAFAGVLWLISPWLLLAAVLYPLVGTSLTVLVGRRLVALNNQQLKKEADFRFALVHVRDQAESIALVHAEKKEEAHLNGRLGALVANYRAIISVLRNLKFFTGGYNYLTQLIPVLIVAPLYLRGEVQFGVVTQAAVAFSQVFNAFSLIIEQFQNLSTYAAVVNRVGTLQEAIDQAPAPERRPLQVAEEDTHVAYQGVTLQTPGEDRVLVRDLSLEVPRGRRVLVTGPNGSGKSALFRATAGLWQKGAGRIVRPVRDRVLFLPERPYLVPGTLRDQFLTAGEDPGDDRLRAVLRRVGLEPLAGRLGGLDVSHDWPAVLSLGEQQLVAFARLLVAGPDFAFLDRAASGLNEDRRRELYGLLAATSVTYVSVGERQPSLLGHHDLVLELREDGSWRVGPPPKEAA